MDLLWILFCAMKTLGSYIILVGIFYQLLIQLFIFYRNIYLPTDNMITTFHLIMIFLTSIFNILNCYFKFINPSQLLNTKQKPLQNLLKRYRKRLYQQKIKIRKFIPTNNQLLEKTDKANRPMTKRHPEINRYLLSNLRCYIAPKKHSRETKFDTNSFKICADSGD